MRPEALPGWLARMLGNARPKPAAGPAPRERTTPLTRARVAAHLTRRGYRFLLDEDGDLTGTWDGSRFWFLLLGEHGEILQVRGRWHRSLPIAQRAAVLLAVNDWNRERIWPKVYLREEDGELALYSEVSVDLEHGVTDSQLAQLLACGLGTGVQVFAALDALLPAPPSSS
ncbi:YbjN domain-containing protein [Cellulomonas fimi]|uniref:YbjN domain-containing protein n=1 Tax=Cellulomonas fimi TaxID=1708 RepID=A0A7Y0QHU6_CELFI|nr:YbjN domain-containing protein [Cellulomonas fimi]NMR19517.1 YbjN domain-containing protein [Cellulomonas fimi]